MYGFIYNTLRTLVVDNFGEETWKEICDEAGCPLMKDGIVDRHYYDESILETVAGVAEKKLDLPRKKIFELFGNFFFVVCKRSGHSSMLRTLGHNLHGFLMNLDCLHDHLAFTYTEMRAPSFICEKTESGLTLHYYSKRPELSQIVIGIVKAVAKDFYSLEIDMEMTKEEELDQHLPYHYTFSIEVKEVSKDENYLERLTGERQFEPRQDSLDFTPEGSSTSVCPFSGGVGSNTPSSADFKRLKDQLDRSGLDNKLKARLSASRIHNRRGSTNPLTQWPITQRLFEDIFPFHIIFDDDLTIRFLGTSLRRLFPKAIIKGEKLSKYFMLTRPAVALNYENIRGSIHNIFIMRMLTNNTNGKVPEKAEDSLHFRGQMILLASCGKPSILFLGSPRVNSIEELQHQNLFLSDIPIHDVTRDLLLLNRHFQVEMGIAKELEEIKRDLQIQKGRAEEEKLRADTLLHAMLPRSVANELKKNRTVSAMDFPSVTILFSDIKGFTNICNQCSPILVVEMLNNLYTHFDGQLEVHQVYKVETIGDAYMVASGLLETSKDHAAAVTNMAFAMRNAAGSVMDPVNNEPIKIRIGIHSGGVVAGVVGLKMPRYCLFGDTVNTASRMESHGEPGRIHLSAATYEFIKDQRDKYVFYSRGKIEVKGLGKKQTYFVESASSTEEIGDIIDIQPEPESAPKTSVSSASESSSSLQPGISEQHNSSFIALSTCTRVPPTQPMTPQFGEPPTPTDNGPRGIKMAKPVHKTSIVTTIAEETEIEDDTTNHTPITMVTPNPVNGHNGVTPSVMVGSETRLPSTHQLGQPTRQRSRMCMIS